MTESHSLAETEDRVIARLGHLDIDWQATAVSANLFRAANAVRNHFERSVLQAHELSWTAFVVLWVTWIWEPIETRMIAIEGAFSKATLTGVLKTLESKKLAKRTTSEKDRRLVLVELTAKGRKLMEQLFPLINAQEAAVASELTTEQKIHAAEALRLMTNFVEQHEPASITTIARRAGQQQ